jgi:hypothetical protein
MLFRGVDFFVNGEQVESPARDRAALARLADERSLAPGARVSRPLASRLHAWYLAGWVHVGDRDG